MFQTTLLLHVVFLSQVSTLCEGYLACDTYSALMLGSSSSKICAIDSHMYHDQDSVKKITNREIPFVNSKDLGTILKNGQHIKVGQGATGSLYLCQYRDKLCVIKYFTGPTESFEKELEIGLALNGTGSVVPVYGQVYHDGQLLQAYVSRFIGNETSKMSRTFHTILKEWNEEKWSDGEVLSIVIQTAHKLKTIHEAGYFHGDVRSDNIMVDDHLEPCFSDLGQAAKHNDAYSYTINSEFKAYLEEFYDYIAPELKQGGMFSKAADVYSFGHLLKVVSRQQKREKLMSYSLKCLDKNPENRPGMHDVVSYLEGIM